MRRITFVLGATLLLLGSCRSTTGPGSPPNPPQTFVPVNTQAGATFAAIKSEKVLQAAMHYPHQKLQPVQEVPMSLTAADGTGLTLTALRGKAVVQGPLAFTELHLSFHNPENRVREGRFTITLPPGAAISRFAMQIGQQWQESEVVERQKARQVYEDFLHRKQDPALLEKKAGNEFRARVFPIPANGTKEIKISYSQKLSALEQPYKLYLKGLPKIKELEIQALVSEQAGGQSSASSLGGETISHKVVRVSKTDFAPDQDFVVPVDSSIGGLRNDNLALVRVSPEIPDAKANMESLLVLVDTSASRASSFFQQVEQLGAVIHHLQQIHGPDLPLHIACFDQMVGSVYQGPLGEFSRHALDQILARRPLGASDLHGALSWVGQTKGYRRLLLVTDGIITSGQTDNGAVRTAVKQLAAQVHRLDVMLVGGITDEAAMQQLVAGTLEQDGVVLEGDLNAELIAQRLSQRTLSGIKVTVPGAKWVWPAQLDGVQPHNQVLVFADLSQGALTKDKPMTVVLSGPISQQQSIPLTTVKRPLLERAWIEGRIAHLQQQEGSDTLDPDLKDAIHKQIIKLSTDFRVLSDYTAMLVLETENDYARYGIQRTALADILVVGPSGIEVLQRGQEDPRPPIVRRPPPMERQPGFPDGERDDRRRNLLPQGAPAPSVASPPQEESKSAPLSFDEDKSSEKEDRSSASAGKMKRRAESGPSAPRFSSRERSPRPKPASRVSPAKSSAPMIDEAPSSTVMATDKLAPPPPQQQPAVQLPQGPPALTGKVAIIMELIKAQQVDQALVEALRWRAEQPGDVMALVALGEALQAYGNILLAARVYGSIIDLFPSRADMRRFAGERLEALGSEALKLAADTYEKAVEQRPDHQSAHRLLAFTLVRIGEYEKAFNALEKGLKQEYRISRNGTDRVMREDLGLVAAAWIAKEPNRKAELLARLQQLGSTLAVEPSLRFVLNWETDANDVDFHIYDGQGGHAYYSNRNLSSGGTLFADITNGYGPECFAIPHEAKAYPYTVQLHYYSRGPMGYGMGKLQIIQHDGKGGLAFSDRPFMVMNDQAYVDLGNLKGPL